MKSTKSGSVIHSAIALSASHWRLMLCFMLVGITSCASLQAQHPDAHQEPYHIPIYEWDCLRFLNVRAKPGDTTALHVHRNPILYLTIAGAEVWLDDHGKEPRTVPLADGWVGSNAYGDGDTLLHRFAVRGDNALHILAVEITGKCSLEVPRPLAAPFYSENGFEVFAISWEEYVEQGFYRQFPAVVPPNPITREGWAKYGAGHILKPVPQNADYVHASGVEVLWVVLPRSNKY